MRARAPDRRPLTLSLVAAAALAGCPGRYPEPDAGDARDAASPYAAGTWCALGADVPGAVPPPGFCVRRFARVVSPRTLAFAPDGDLFVGAPALAGPGGSHGGPGAVLVLADDDRDGAAETHVFLAGVPDVHGIALGGGHVYYTTTRTVFRTPYAPGQRAAARDARGVVREDLALPARYEVGRWTHGLARSVGGALITSRGEYGNCGFDTAGEVAQAGPRTLDAIAVGFRNPMYLRCHHRDEACFAAELGEDGTPGAIEKIVRLRTGTNYGHPCCQTTDRPATATCAGVTREDAEFPLGDTPFGLDWERGRWPAPYRDAMFVALHGSFYTNPPWRGARLVFAETDATTHAPSGPFRDFLTGFAYEPGSDAPANERNPLDRPSDVAFAPDGRLFFSDDLGNAVYWLAPADLRVR